MQLGEVYLRLDDAPLDVTVLSLLYRTPGRIVSEYGDVTVTIKDDDRVISGITLRFANWQQMLSLAEQLRDIAHQAELEQMTAVQS